MKILSPVKSDAAFYYRVRAPFEILDKTTSHSWHVGTASPEKATEYDILWLQQSLSQTEYTVARDWKETGRLIVYDVDDWLGEQVALGERTVMLGLPPSWDGVTADQIEIHGRCLELADVVTTTTAYLGGKLRSILPKTPIVILPNCIRQLDWDLIPAQTHGVDGPVLGWFGLNHWDDWLEIARPVDEALKVCRGYLAFIGRPDALACFPRSLIDRVLYYPLVPMSQFGQVRRMIKAFDIGLAWATDRTAASRCRSPLKAWQYGAAGKPIVTSQTVYGTAITAGYKNGKGGEPTYHDEAVTVVRDIDNLAAALCEALSHVGDLDGPARDWQAEVFNRHSYERCASDWLTVLDLLQK